MGTRIIALVLVACAAISYLEYRRAAPAYAQPASVAAPITSDIAPQVSSDPREQFALDVLRGVGNDAPSPEILAFLVEWTIAEDGGDGALNRNNPLNTTQPSTAETGSINADGVRAYATYQDGLDATLHTLTNGFYDGVVVALQSNNPDAARTALWASPWAASHYGGGAGWPHVDAQVPLSGIASTPISLAGDCGYNVQVALDASGGALWDVTLRPGETWSFNATVGNPGLLSYRMCAGVPAGNWCNAAARYAQVARAMGLQLDFLHHGVDLGAGIENDVLIWNVGGQSGFENGAQDLLITNTLAQPVRFQAQSDGGNVTIIGGVL